MFFSQSFLAKTGTNKAVQLVELYQEGIVPMDGVDLMVSDLLAQLLQGLIGESVLLRDKIQIGIGSDDVYLGGNRCHDLLETSPILADVNGFNQLIHELISLKGKAVLEFFSMMKQPSLGIEAVALDIDTTVELFLERGWGTITKHGVHAGIVQGVVALQESFLYQTVGYYPVGSLPVGSHGKEVGYIFRRQGKHLPGNTAA